MTYTPDYAKQWAIWRTRKFSGKTLREIGSDFGYFGGEQVRKIVLMGDRRLAFALKQEWQKPCADHARDGTLGVTFTFTLGEEGYSLSFDEGEE